MGSPFKGTDIARLLAAFGLFGDITFEIAVRGSPCCCCHFAHCATGLSSTCIEVNTLDVHSECSKSLPLLVYLTWFQLLSTGSLGLCWFESFGGTTSSLSCLRRIRCCCLFGHFPRQRCMKLLTNSLNLDTFILRSVFSEYSEWSLQTGHMCSAGSVPSYTCVTIVVTRPLFRKRTP